MNIDNIKVGDWVQFDKSVSNTFLSSDFSDAIKEGRLFKVERVAGQYIHIMLYDKMYHLFKGHVTKHVSINENGSARFEQKKNGATETPQCEMTDLEKAHKYIDQMFDLVKLTGDKISLVRMHFNDDILADPPLVLNEANLPVTKR